MGKGLGFVDVHLLASTLLAAGEAMRLWMRDGSLGDVALQLGIAHRRAARTCNRVCAPPRPHPQRACSTARRRRRGKSAGSWRESRYASVAGCRLAVTKLTRKFRGAASDRLLR